MDGIIDKEGLRKAKAALVAPDEKIEERRRLRDFAIKGEYYLLFQCISQAERGNVSWERAMNTAARELSKIVKDHEKTICRLLAERVSPLYPENRR